jgi:hypothetical protein
MLLRYAEEHLALLSREITGEVFEDENACASLDKLTFRRQAAGEEYRTSGLCRSRISQV